MGMKPRKTPITIIKTSPTSTLILGNEISASLQESIDAQAGGLRELLKDYYKVPKERWQDALNVDSLEDDYPEFMDDPDGQWILGWFRGVADALGCEAGDLVVL
jgi:hypothetical protein